MPQALLAVFSNPTSAESEVEYNDWYDHIHLKDVVAVPGIIAAQRFRLVDVEVEGGIPWPAHRYLAIYEVDTDDLDALSEEISRRDGTEAMPISPAIDMSYSAFYWKPIGSRVVQS
jgi:hypothetical protein